MREGAEKRGRGAPIIRLRSMAAWIAGIVVLISIPLALVWKQSYIANTSVRLEAMTDTLSALNKKIAVLQLQCARLSSTERIERLARTRLDLDYPSSDRIVIVAKERGGVEKLFASARGHLSKGRRE